MNTPDTPQLDATKISVETHGDRLIFRWHGPFEPAAHRAQAIAVLNVCRQRNCTKALINISAQEGDMSMADRFDLARDLAASWDLAVRVALVDRPQRVLPDRFFETVVNNRGPTMKTFTDEADALAWL